MELPVAAGQIIAERYLVGEMLGGGGMGVVLAGTHVLLNTPVAIKLIHSELKDDPEAVQRFVSEARATAALKGEHIARVFDVGLLPTGEPYLVMERLEGMSLDEYLEGRGPLNVAEATAIVLQVCEGLAEAHAAALVHRDIKPANLFLARALDGRQSLKILDFGIAKHRLRPEELAITNPGKSLGSPWYMSPEQMLTPANVDERADVWSIGVLLFELLTARVPFDGESVPQVCANVLGAPAPRPSELCSSIPPELDVIVLRCLEKAPEQRYQSVQELARALAQVVATPHVSSALSLEPARRPATAPRPSELCSSIPPELDVIVLRCLEKAPEQRYQSVQELARALAQVVATPHVSSALSLDDVQAPRAARRSGGWRMPAALVTLSALVAAAWLEYRDPTLLYRALSSPRLEDSTVLAPGGSGWWREPAGDSPRLLQILHDASAAAEIASSSPPPARPRAKPARPRQPGRQRLETGDRRPSDDSRQGRENANTNTNSNAKQSTSSSDSKDGASWDRITEDRYGL